MNKEFKVMLINKKVVDVILENEMTAESFLGNYDLSTVEESEYYCSDDTRSREEFYIMQTKEVQDFFENFSSDEKAQKFLETVADDMPLKANGTLYKNRIQPLYVSDFFQEWEDSYCRVYPSVRAKAMSDDLISISFHYHKDKY